MAEAAVTPVPGLPSQIVDPHFHFWDSVAHPNPNLGDIVSSIPRYIAADYEADVATLGVRVAAAVHVETVVGQSRGGYELDEVAETAFVVEQSSALPFPVSVVAYAHLAPGERGGTARSVAHTVEAHSAVAGPRLRGVRMILNYMSDDASLCWPQVTRGDFLTGGVPEFKDGFAELARAGLVFDCQVNPPQLLDLASLLSGSAGPHPRVVVNHLGVPRMGAHRVAHGADAREVADARAKDAAVLRTWRAGMAALAAREDVYVKASMLSFIAGEWESPACPKLCVCQRGCASVHHCVVGLVREVIGLFGPRRVMFASNFPVDKYTGSTLRGLYTAFAEIASVYSPEDREQLFSGTAIRAYGLVA